eukprot:TRINITY_DN5493_c0_g1_i3.p1 TRINITY_DN5493_c0_g1~~TRINITY_DN5493_c0_g1_i3.p1  ORF type:complete len:205 (+),score=38.27 TRINITY_DN5493_c0_g1_i3:43-615(+)
MAEEQALLVVLGRVLGTEDVARCRRVCRRWDHAARRELQQRAVPYRLTHCITQGTLTCCRQTGNLNWSPADVWTDSSIWRAQMGDYFFEQGSDLSTEQIEAINGQELLFLGYSKDHVAWEFITHFERYQLLSPFYCREAVSRVEELVSHGHNYNDQLVAACAGDARNSMYRTELSIDLYQPEYHKCTGVE